MAFFGLFKTAEVREAELKSRVRLGTNRINQFVRQLTTQSKQYSRLARKSFDLGDTAQFREMGVRFLKCLDAINRWQRYQIKLNAMELQRNEVRTTKEFLQSMNSLTSSILEGVSTDEIANVARDMELAESKCEELEQNLKVSMEDHLGFVCDSDEVFDPPSLESEAVGSSAAELKTLQLESGSTWKNQPESTNDSVAESESKDIQFWKAIHGIREAIRA